MRNSDQTLMSRRRFIQWSGTLTITPVLLANGFARAGIWNKLFGSTKRTTSPITSNNKFYITSYRTPPFVPADRWALTIRRTVISPFILTYPDLLAQPANTEIVTLECVGNRVEEEAIGTAEWQGVRLKALLDKARATSYTQDVVLHPADGYSDSLTIEGAMMDDTMVAYRMDGGAPAFGTWISSQNDRTWALRPEAAGLKAITNVKTGRIGPSSKPSPGSRIRKPEIPCLPKINSPCRALPLPDPGGFVG